MLRHVGGSGRAAAGLAAAAAVAAPASTAQCRAETTSPPAGGADARAKTPAQHPAAPPPAAWTSVPDDWVDAAASVSDADIADAVASVLRVVSPPPPGAGAAVVRELGATSDEEGTPAGAASPTVALAVADARLAALQANAAVRADFGRALTSLLSHAEVRSACARALAADPAFADLMRTVGAQAEVPVDDLLPAAARAAARLPAPDRPAGDGDPLAAFFDALADGLVRLGQGVGCAASAVGKVAIEAGYRIHRLLTAPFGAQPAYLAGPAADGGASRHRPRRPSADAPLGSAEFWKDVLTTVACVVVSVLLVKRLPRGRPAV